MAKATKDRTSASDLGIDVAQGDAEQFRWLAACLLFATRIKQELAAEAFRALDAERIVTPQQLAAADWQQVVNLLGQSNYKRYDESKARELIQLGHDVVERYDGLLSRLAEGADDRRAVEKRLQEFQGIGPTGADIFLREVGPVWRV